MLGLALGLFLGGAAAPAQTYDEAVLADGPQAFWMLDEREAGPAVDASGNGFNAEYVGGPVFGVPGPVESGSGATAVVLDGVDDSIDTPLTLDPADGFTFEFWIRPAVLAPAALIQHLGGGRTLLGIGPDGNELFTFSDGSFVGLGTSLPTGEWTHVAFSYANGGYEIFIDGRKAGGGGLNPESRNEALVIGRHNTRQDRFFQGALDRVAVYDRALGEAAVFGHFEAAVANDDAGPATVFYVDPAHPNASDNGSGSDAQPFRTLNRGLEEAGANRVLRIAPGFYDEVLALPRGGALGAPFVIEAEKSGTVHITASAPRQLFPETRGGADHVTVRGLHFTGSTDGHWAAAVEAGSDWTLEDVRIFRAHAGIVVNPADAARAKLRLRNVLVEDCAGAGLLVRAGSVFDSTGLTGLDVEASTFRRCNLDGRGNGMTGGGAVIYGATDINIRESRFYDNQGPGLWITGDSRAFAVTDNLFFGNYGPPTEDWLGIGLQISDAGSFDGASRAEVTGNRFRSNERMGLVLAEASGIDVRNNVFIGGQVAVVFRNYRIFSAGSQSIQLEDDDSLRGITVSGNAFRDWRASAVATWPMSLMRPGDLSRHGIQIDGNRYQAGPSPWLFTFHDDITEAPPEFEPLRYESFDRLRQETGFEATGAFGPVEIPEGLGWGDADPGGSTVALEYLFGGDPFSVSANAALWPAGPGPVWDYRVRRDAVFSPRVEASGDLMLWQDDPSLYDRTLLEEGDGWRLFRIEPAGIARDKEKFFFRLATDLIEP